MAILFQRNNITLTAQKDYSAVFELPSNANWIKYSFDNSGANGLYDNRDPSIRVYIKVYINFDGSDIFPEDQHMGIVTANGGNGCPLGKDLLPDCITSQRIDGLPPEQGFPRQIKVAVWLDNPPTPPIRLTNYIIEAG